MNTYISKYLGQDIDNKLDTISTIQNDTATQTANGLMSSADNIENTYAKKISI